MAAARLAAAGLTAAALAAGLAACGSSGASKVVERAHLVNSSRLAVTVWHDPGTGDLALRVARQPPVTVLHGHELIGVPDGRIDRFPSIDAAWAYLSVTLGVTKPTVDRALKHAVRVPRPAWLPGRLPTRSSVTTADHYTTIDDLRKAVKFFVPDPGTQLNRLRRFDLHVVRPGAPFDPAPVVNIVYRSKNGTGGVTIVGSDSEEGRRIAGRLKTDVGPRLRGPHFVANTGDDSYQFKCGDSYVSVSMYVSSLERWRAVLTQVSRDCPA